MITQKLNSSLKKNSKRKLKLVGCCKSRSFFSVPDKQLVFGFIMDGTQNVLLVVTFHAESSEIAD